MEVPDCIFPKEQACCFTGHRPQKLHVPEETVKQALREKIEEAISDGYRVFITGMSTGVDLWAGEIVLEKMRENPQLKIVAAIPYRGFGKQMGASWKKIYQQILDAAAQEMCISEKYYRAVYQLRDEWMVDSCSRVIAVYNGEPGGTRNTMAYAEKTGVQVIPAV